MTNAPKPIKPKSKGYFDNSEMLDYLRQKKEIKELLTIEMDVYTFREVEYTKALMVRKFERVNNEIGKLYIKVANGVMKRPNFMNYPEDQKNDMLSDACYLMSRAGERYNTDYPNPFAYFSQITFNSFLQSIKNMKKRIGLLINVDYLENIDELGNNMTGVDE